MYVAKILCPTDFSASSQAALAYAASLARDFKAELIVAHVDEGPLAYDAGMGSPGDIGQPDQPSARLAEVTSAIQEVKCTARLLEGDPASQIVELACEEDIDLIVMGTHGRTGLARLLMGSIAEIVLRRAPCPVLALKQPQSEVRNCAESVV
jgi:nucleotide-binding universal stress UspA family protein